MRKYKKILLIGILIILVFSNISLGLTEDEDNRYMKIGEMYGSFRYDNYSYEWDEENKCFSIKDLNNNKEFSRTYDELKDDMECLEKIIKKKYGKNEYTNNSDKECDRKIVENMKTILKLGDRIKERDENNNDPKKQQELKDYSVGDMVEYYIKHEYSLKSLPDNGNVKETWISKLKKTDEYKFYIKATEDTNKGSGNYTTGERYYNMIEEMDPTMNEERAIGGEKKPTIYRYPSKEDATSAGSLDDMIGDADSFISKANGKSDVVTSGSLQDFSQTFYNILLTVGIIVAVLVGSVIGIKFMIGGAEEKANIKELLVPYIAGCILVFGAFAIWKIVVTVLSGV